MIIQVCILASRQINPMQIVTNIEEKVFEEIDFPVLFNICFNPAFHTKIGECYPVFKVFSSMILVTFLMKFGVPPNL